MGLDQNIYRIRKVELENRTFERDELDEYNIIAVREADERVIEVIPYAVVRKVEFKFIDIEKIFKDYNIPDCAYCGMISSEVYKYNWRDGNEYKSVEVPTETIRNNYIKKEILDAYIWKTKELQYWRKNYDAQDFIYRELDADNCKYCLLSTDIQQVLIDEYDADFEVEENTEDSGIFYWEWY